MHAQEVVSLIMGGNIEIDRELCKGCGLCIEVCHRGIISLEQKINGRGYHPAIAVNFTNCNACARCAQMCPEVAITVERVGIHEGVYERERGAV